MVRRPHQERKIPGSNPTCAGVFSGWSHTSDLKIATPVATLPGAWHYRVSTGTGWPGVTILWLDAVEHWSATSISVWQQVKLSEQICPWDTLAYCWDIKQPTKKPTTIKNCTVYIFFRFLAQLYLTWPHVQCVCMQTCSPPEVLEIISQQKVGHLQQENQLAETVVWHTHSAYTGAYVYCFWTTLQGPE